MRLQKFWLQGIILPLVLLSSSLPAQNYFNTGLNGTVINLLCNQNCVTTAFKVPHLKSSSDYTVNSIAYNPFPFVTTAPALIHPCTDQDDKYFDITTLPFPFCFYDSAFTKLVISTNGSITFDTSNALKGANYNLNTAVTLPYEGTGTQTGTGICTAQNASIRLPKAAIFGVFCDIFPEINDPLYKMEARVEGTAPLRRFVISFSNVRLFNCQSVRLTSEIVLYESTGVIDIFIQNKPVCTSSLAIVGIQNYAIGTPNAKGLTAPGRGANNGSWSATNEAWRFTPSGGVSRFVSSKLYDLSGTLVSTGDTITTTAGLLDVTFPNFCPAAGKYVMKTIYSSCDNPTNFLESSDTITVNKTTDLNATAAVTQTNCGLTGTGTATVTVPTGIGTAPYTYVLAPGNITQTGNNVFNNLTAGNYTINVTDASAGCSSSIPVTITSNGILNVNFTTTNTSCPGASNGSITVNVPNATPPVTYSINGGNFVPTNVFSGLAAGTYFMSVQDNGGCSATFLTAQVANGTSTLAGTATSLATSCSGVNNGSITVTPTGGTGPFEYSINNGTNWQSSNTFTGLAPGNYTAIIREGGVCRSNGIAVTVAQGSGLQATAVPTPATCTGADDGMITVTPGNGSAPYEYAVDGGAFQSSNVFTNVADGPHTVVVRDAAGCVSSSIDVFITSQGLAAALGVVSTSCLGATDGAIVVTLATNVPGTPPYWFSLNGGPYQNSNTFTNLAAGNYTLEYYDSRGCLSDDDIPITVPAGPALTGTATSTSTACIGVNNGSVTVNAGAGFTGPFEYSLDGGAFQLSNLFTGVAAGNHNAVVRKTGCISANIPVTVAAGTTLAGTAVPVNVSCNGGTNGSITVTPTNGSAPYLYSLDGGANQSSNVFNGVAAGAHTINITDAFGCISPAISITITQPAVLTSSAPSVQNVKCNGANNGTITVNPNGGTTPYSYSLDNINFQPGNSFTVSQGTYTVYIRDANNCSVQFNNIAVTQPAALNATVVSTANATCNGGNDGTIEINATGGTAAYQYSVDGTTFQASNILNVKSGNYTITIKDANNCVFSIPNIAVGLTNNIALSVNNPAPVCEGSNVQLQATGNATAYSWTSTLGLPVSPVSNPTVSPNVTTTYTVTATLGNCSKTADVIVAILPAPIPDAGIDGDICFGQDYQLQASGGVSYTWTPSTYLSSASANNPRVIRPDKTTTYTLSVIGANNCPSLITDDITVNVTPPIKVVTSPVDTVVSAGDKFQLTAVSAGTFYTWFPTTGLDNPGIPDPVVTAGSSGDVTMYQVTATTSAGCIGTGYVTVRVYKGPDIYVPNAFTPNGDGKNEFFIPFPVGIKQLNYFRIFNRWGQMVYSTTTLRQGWDGKVAGVDQPNGVYMWMVEGITENGKKISKKGTVTLIR